MVLAGLSVFLWIDLDMNRLILIEKTVFEVKLENDIRKLKFVFEDKSII